MDEPTGIDAGKEKGGKNKRKLVDPSAENPVNLPSSLIDLPEYEFPVEKSQNPSSDIGPFQVESSRGWLGEEFEIADWDDPIACQLEELLSSNLHTIFKNAIKKIVDCGYGEEVAEQFISRHGLYLGGRDLESNIVNYTLDFLKKRNDCDTSGDHLFENLQNLVEYTMLEMISVLREVKPSLSIAEAMWLLLMCDLNILMACEVEGDVLHNFGCKEVSGEGSIDSNSQWRSEAQKSETIPPNPNEPNISKLSLPNSQSFQPETLRFGSFPSLPNPQNPLACEGLTPDKENSGSSSATKGHVQITSQVTVLDEKSVAGRKGRTKKEIAALRAKALNVEKYRAYGKGGFRSGKLAAFGGFFMEKKMKNPSEIPAMHVKNASMKRNTEAGASANGNHHVSANMSASLRVTDNSSTCHAKLTVSALSKADTKLAESSSLEKKPAQKYKGITSVTPKKPDHDAEKTPKKADNDAERNPAPKSEDNISKPCKEIEYYVGIPYDESLGKYAPQDDKDKLILKLVPRLQDLQKELHTWIEWANQKVMQAARRLSVEQPELKLLRQEKEEGDQFKKEKQIMEENTVKRLSEMELALNNASNQVERANSTICRLEVENSLLKKDMKAAQLQAAESAARCREAMEREQKALKDTQSCEGQKSLIQEELETRKKVLAELQKEVDKAKSLYNQAEARLKQEMVEKEKVLKHAASIRWEREGMEAAAKAEEDKIKLKAESERQKYGEEIKRLQNELSELRIKLDSSKIAALRSTDSGFGMFSSTSKGNQIPSISKRIFDSQDNIRSRGLKQDCECVMCLSDEKVVVFLPCAHQVLCAKCNERHEEEMKECPICRTPIQRRIHARFP
ncbi:hypothetical protein SLA2020_165550 [Shorea laevis]